MQWHRCCQLTCLGRGSRVFSLEFKVEFVRELWSIFGCRNMIRSLGLPKTDEMHVRVHPAVQRAAARLGRLFQYDQKVARPVPLSTAVIGGQSGNHFLYAARGSHGKDQDYRKAKRAGISATDCDHENHGQISARDSPGALQGVI